MRLLIISCLLLASALAQTGPNTGRLQRAYQEDTPEEVVPEEVLTQEEPAFVDPTDVTADAGETATVDDTGADPTVEEPVVDPMPPTDVEPSDDLGPENAVDPIEPVDPVVPDEPAVDPTPDTPTEPVDPTPDTPTDPVDPTPVTPVTPTKPAFSSLFPFFGIDGDFEDFYKYGWMFGGMNPTSLFNNYYPAFQRSPYAAMYFMDKLNRANPKVAQEVSKAYVQRKLQRAQTQMLRSPRFYGNPYYYQQPYGYHQIQQPVYRPY